MVPNIFRYATKELSQDTVICWLVACGREANEDLRECGLSFVRALMRSGSGRVIDARSGNAEDHRGEGRVTGVVNGPARQYGGIDVYFQAKLDGKVVSFVVEDKTHTEMHGGQLERYRGVVGEDAIEEDLVKAVYFKTGYVFGDEREKAERAGYSVFDAEDIVTFFRDGRWSGTHDSYATSPNTWRAWSTAGGRRWRNGIWTEISCSGSSWSPWGRCWGRAGGPSGGSIGEEPRGPSIRTTSSAVPFSGGWTRGSRSG